MQGLRSWKEDGNEEENCWNEEKVGKRSVKYMIYSYIAVEVSPQEVSRP